MSRFSKFQYLIGWLGFFCIPFFFLLLEGEAFKAQNGLNSQRTCSAALSVEGNFHKMEHSTWKKLEFQLFSYSLPILQATSSLPGGLKTRFHPSVHGQEEEVQKAF